jgi:hypothetical protein
MVAGPHYTYRLGTDQRRFQKFTPLLRVTEPLPRNICFSGSTFLALSKIHHNTFTYPDHIDPE